MDVRVKTLQIRIAVKGAGENVKSFAGYAGGAGFIPVPVEDQVDLAWATSIRIKQGFKRETKVGSGRSRVQDNFDWNGIRISHEKTDPDIN